MEAILNNSVKSSKIFRTYVYILRDNEFIIQSLLLPLNTP